MLGVGSGPKTVNSMAFPSPLDNIAHPDFIIAQTLTDVIGVPYFFIPFALKVPVGPRGA
jgi:hypothetical protein